MNNFKSENIAEIEIPSVIFIKDSHNDSEDGQYNLHLDIDVSNWVGELKSEEEFNGDSLIKSKSTIFLARDMELLKLYKEGHYISTNNIKREYIYPIGAETESYFNIKVDDKTTELCYAGNIDAIVSIEEHYEGGVIQRSIIIIENDFSSTQSELSRVLKIKNCIKNTDKYSSGTNKRLTYRDKYSILMELIDEDPCLFAKQHGIKEEDRKVLEGWMTSRTNKWLASNAGYRMDIRRKIDFAQDLVMSRILELYLIDYFKEEYDYEFMLNGCDKNDILDTKNKITAEADLVDSKGNLIEVISDKANFWKNKNNNSFDLRNYKFDKMLKKSNELSINGKSFSILAVNMLEKKYQRIVVNENLEVQKVKSIPQFGYKDGYNIKIDESKYIKFKRIK